MDIEMVFVEGGTFQMGCTPEQEVIHCGNDEKPVHSVTVSSFRIGKYEITQAQWVAVMNGNPSGNKTDDQQPVESISWYEAVAFCNALSDKMMLTPAYAISGTTVTLNSSYTGYRLPTEAEWEYAARGCKVGNCENFAYSGSNNASEVAWYADNSGGKSHPVGQKKPNGLGIYDMSGNVWEWAYDWQAAYQSNAQTNPTGPVSGGSNRVLRGQSFSHAATDAIRVAARNSWPSPNGHSNLIGLRVVLPAQ
ncbi:MAG: formylglycine-generating enzyme family protein [Prevotellaceae bacterium]|nr:formylglycine-generating enzyme family protein [Prevotellaceae bacterium]